MNIQAEFTYAAGTSSQLKPSDKPEIVFSGRSNVGKSSLINKLTARKSLARVSSKPGKTATINFFDAGRFTLVDLPGYGYAKVSKSEKLRWAELVEGYFAQKRDIRLVVQIVDIRHRLTEDDMNMMNFMDENGLPFIIVMTKKDKLNKRELKEQLDVIKTQLEAFEGVETFSFSALSGEGADDIKNALERCLDA